MENYFSRREQEVIRDCKNQSDEFYRIWTRKEAAIKTTGVGLNCKLSEVDTSEENVIFKSKTGQTTLYLRSLKFLDTYISLGSLFPIEIISETEINNLSFRDFFAD
jgi:phosphopantetheinyl transferase